MKGAPQTPVRKNIVIVGYPKSGCTWLTRLVAELVGCPVAGFWKSDKKEIAVEGEERESEYRCYKSHHTLSELGADESAGQTQIIYVSRDPRDVAVSGASYFYFDRFPALARFFSIFPGGRKLYRHTLYRLLVPERYRMERMTEAVLHGSAALHKTVAVSWKTHRAPYEKRGVLIVRYEDMLSSPREECARILHYLGIDRSQTAIETAIRNQSFEVKKARFLESGERGRAKFLRVGQNGQWRDKLPARAKEMFAQHLGEIA